MPALQREAAWAEERLLGDLRQSVLQNGRVHLHIIEIIVQPGISNIAVVPFVLGVRAWVSKVKHS